jgi:hypothetical protein
VEAASAFALGPFQEALISNLPRRLASAAVYREPRHRSDAVTCRAKGIERFFESKSKGTDDTGGDNRDAFSCYV